MKYQINETFFEKIDTVQKAWMLGFIVADGCIYERDGHQAMLSISVRDYDIEILELFKRYISPEHSIIQVCDKRRPNTIMSTLQLTSDILCNSLKNIEIRPRKTFDLDITNILQKLPEEYRFAFVLGYFDGDGNIDVPSNGTISKSHVRISGPIKNLKAFQAFLSENHIETSVIEDKRRYKEPFGSLECKNTTSKYCFLKKIYGSEVTSLSRKKEIAKDLCDRIENNVTNRSENKKALEYYNLWF